VERGSTGEKGDFIQTGNSRLFVAVDGIGCYEDKLKVNIKMYYLTISEVVKKTNKPVIANEVKQSPEQQIVLYGVGDCFGPLAMTGCL